MSIFRLSGCFEEIQMFHPNRDYGVWLLPKDKSRKRPILSIFSAQTLEARFSLYRPRHHSMLLFNSLQKERIFFQNIGHWMQTSTGRVWMDYIHFQNP